MGIRCISAQESLINILLTIIIIYVNDITGSGSGSGSGSGGL